MEWEFDRDLRDQLHDMFRNPMHFSLLIVEGAGGKIRSLQLLEIFGILVLTVVAFLVTKKR